MNKDAIIAGGGVAGSAAAAVLAEFGYHVLLIEPGLQHAKRLAGELIHPPGVAALKELGLLACLEQAGGVPVQGFAVLPGPHRLPYKDVREFTMPGLAIDHATMAESLLREVTKLDRVTVWRGARVTAIDLNRRDYVTTTVNRDGSEDQLRADLLVAADGRCSHLRGMAGIRHKQVHLSSMVGHTLKHSRLPHPGFGHLFAGGPSPVLAYELGNGDIRIMLDLPKPEHARASLNALPDYLRSDVEQVMETETPLRAANYSVIPEAVYRGRMVCVGDAGGCCHPLTATGLSACLRDAILLKQALGDTKNEIPKALRRYSALREGPQRTRLVCAKALYDVFRAETPETRLLRQGLFRYWQRPHGRKATMELLSTYEARRLVMVREYLQVCRYALPDLLRSGPARSDAMVGLSRALLKFVGEACMECK